jgi:hypothetical protein
MLNPKAKIVEDQWQVKAELRDLGLTPAFVRSVALAAAGARADALPIDPCSTPGLLAYIYGVRTIRQHLLPNGWRISREGNVESTINHDLGIQLCFQNVYHACGERDPEAISGKGAGSRRLIQLGQGELFEPPAADTVKPIGSTPTVWVVCVSSDARSIRAEVSCPESFEGEQFEGFSKRILVVSETLDPNTGSRKDGDEGDSDFEVRIKKK